MAIEPEFSSISESDSAYYGDSSTDGSDGNTGPGDGKWNDLQREKWLGGDPPWTLAYQTHQTDDTRRWFVIRDNNGTLEAINASGNVVRRKSDQSPADLPHYSLKDDALAAYNTWAESNDAETTTDGSDDTIWGKWQRLRKVDPWWIFSRTATDADRVQFCIASKRDGNAVYLQPDGTISTSIHLYDSVDALSGALEAYSQRVQDGDMQNPPTGEAPSRKTIKKSSSKVHTSQTTQKLAEKLAGKKALVAAVGVAGLAVLTQGDSN